MDREAKLRELENLKSRVKDLEADLAREAGTIQHWQATSYYTGYYATTGFFLGMIAALVSLAFNAVGSLVWTRITGEVQHPLRLIQVYLTFPMGEAALAIDDWLTLAIGCCLYVGTGMLYGVVFQLALTYFAADRSTGFRFVLASGLSLIIWVVNFYGVLSWLQPLLMGDDWIVRLVPPWVAGLTHLVFGWTMVLIYPLGLYVPYRLQTERQ